MNPPQGGPVEASARAGGAVLIIDDEEVVRAAASEVLRYLGYQTLDAPSAEAGLEILRARRSGVVLVILDVSMPGMGCKSCLEELRRLDPHLPVLLASGRMELPEAFGDEPSTQVRGFLPKPFRLRDLQQQIRAAIAGA
jgi:DNA-binding NtrC family response regulator